MSPVSPSKNPKKENITHQKEEIIVASQKEEKTVNRTISALSLKGFKQQQEVVKSNENNTVTQNLPADDFNVEEAKLYWNQYISKLLEQGKKSIASIMKANEITLKENTIYIELPNTLMESQLKMAQTPLLEFLKEKLNNYRINLTIIVNEETTKKYAYTPQEKYEKLKERNQNLELLKKTFHLDL